MNCASCGRANRSGARFCSGCGQALAPRCPRCGAECPADAQFCDACGAALGSPAPPPLETTARKVVTIVFADLVGSVGLHERLDAERARRFMARYHEGMTAVVRAHGGTVVQLLGDGVLCAFGVPRVGEDDAIRGVRAAVAMQVAFRELLREQAEAVGAAGLRIAVNTGEVIVSDDQTSVTGDPTNVAARLQQEARDGDVLLGEATRRLVAGEVTLESLGSFALRGRVEPVSAYRVVSLESPGGARPGTSFVGREDELRRLRAVFDTAVAAPGARMAVLLGSPGLGKSRLLAEFARRVSERATVLSARCDPARGRSFAPVAAALRAQLGLGDALGPDDLRAALERAVPGADAERARLASGLEALFAGAPASPEETFFVVRRLLAGLAVSRPVVLAIDDVQWAEPLLLDLAEHLVEWSSGVPLLVLLGSRPELRELRSSLATPGGVVAEVVTLSGLDASAAARLAANAIGADELPAAVVGRVLAASEGNPLFVGELVRMLVQDGALRRDGERWIVGIELARLEMPPTIHALLAARIERLAADERAILERAAVVGRHFSRAAVAHLLQRDPAELDARLESLRRSELIEPDNGWFLGEPGLRFHHALIRDAAYRRVLRRTRAELHERLAEWIAAQAGEAREHAERIGFHLEQAHAHLRELGPLDSHGGAVGARAARHLGGAGRAALARDELTLAADLLGRALGCLDADDPARAELALDWCESLLAAGEVASASRAVAELARFAPSSERLRAWHACFAAELAVLTDPEALRAAAESAEAAAAALAAAGDVAGEAKAHSVHATALARLGRIGASEAALDHALAAARRAQDRRRANSVLAGAPVAALYGPSPVARASGRCLDVVRVLRITQGAPVVEAVALRCQAVLEALRGRADAARRMIGAARRTVEELGLAPQLLEVEFFAGYIELLEGEPEAAARCLSVAYEGLREHGLAIDAARAAALLARARLAQGDAIGAEVLSQESERLAGDDLQAAIAWRGVRAEALARRGEHAAAVELARAAVEIASATDALLHHANARRALATALRAAGRGAEADAEDARAVELWEAKGATLLAERAGRLARVDPLAQPRRVSDHAAAAQRTRLGPRTLAVLGDSLELARGLEPHELVLSEVDANGRARDEVIASEKLGEAIARLYERYAERLPAGPARSRAAATARAVAALFGPADPDLWAPAFAPGIEFIDTRTVGPGRVRGLEAVLQSIRALFELSASFSVQVVDLWALRADALVVGWANSGERRDGGGGFERDLCQLFAFGPDGRLERWEQFDAGSQSEALARFAALPELRVDAPIVRANAATAYQERVVAAIRARDLDALSSLLADDITNVDHVGVATTYDRERLLQGWRAMFEEGASEVSYDSLASLGDSLTLGRQAYAFDGSSTRDLEFGPTTHESLVLVEVDERGRAVRSEVFMPQNLGDAIARLYERYAELAPDGPERARAAATARSVSALPWRGRLDLERYASSFSPEVRLLDHRTVGAGVVTGAEAVTRAIRTLLELSAELSAQVPRVIGVRPDALLALHVTFGRDLVSGGEFERSAVMLWQFGADGRLTRFEQFDLSREAEARERFLALGGASDSSSVPPANAATRALERFERAWNARDWPGVAASYAPGHAMDDRRRLFRMQVESADFVANERHLFELEGSRWQSERVATRGERLGLFRVRFGARAGSGGGPSAVEALDVIEVDALGRRRALVVFDSDALDEALAELGRRHALGESLGGGAPVLRIENAASRSLESFGRAWEARDWTACVALIAPDFRCEDRRGLMQLELDRAQFLAFMRELYDTIESQLPNVILATRGQRLALARLRYSGSGDTVGASESENLAVVEVDEHGQRTAMVRFDSEELEEAYDELERRYASGEAAPFPTTRDTLRRLESATAARDWSALASVFAPDLVFHDHRPMGFGTLRSRDEYLAHLRELFELAPDVRSRAEHVLELDERGVLNVGHWQGTRDGGPFEIAGANLLELDGAGRIWRWDAYALEQLELARAHFAERRAVPGQVAPNAAWHFTGQRLARIVPAGDWDALRALVTPDFVFDDRRRQALVRGDVETYVRNLSVVRSWGEIALQRELLATSGQRLALERLRYSGGAGEGAFEGEFLRLVELDAGGRLRGFVHFDPEDRAAAQAELRARAEPPQRAIERFASTNQATVALDRLLAALAASDWRGARRLCAGGAELERGLAELCKRVESGAVRARTLVGAADPRSAVELLRGDSAESLWMLELDAEGRIALLREFAPDERPRALRELRDRLCARDPVAAAVLAPGIELADALDARDSVRVRAVLSDDFVLLDHRRMRLGLLEGPAAYAESVAVMAELASRVRVVTPFRLALEPHGVVSVVQVSGTLVQGGEFEGNHLALMTVAAGRITRIEFFEPDDAEHAVARLAELRA
ncbi:MAG TPA: nuclear transport factor 2 family protein [Myxococcota bacterium]|nr:nuclear transport factor 2 family protein [Myxococcota bacterium]